MNRRDALKIGGASVFAGTLLSTSATANRDRHRNQNRDWGEDRHSIVDRISDDDSDGDVLNNETDADVVDFELDAGSTDENEYTVTYDDETVTLTGNLVVPTPCDELVVENLVSTDYGDVVDFALRRDQPGCVQVIAGVSFSITLEYESPYDVPDVLVSTPESDPDAILIDAEE